MDDPPITNLERWGPLVLALVALVTAIALAGPGWSPLDLKGDTTKIVQVLGSLLVIALILERALSVVNDLLFGPEKRKAETKIRRASTTLRTLHTAAALTPDDNADLVATAFNNLLAANTHLEEGMEQKRAIDTRRERLRLGVGFLVAALIAAVGMRAFSSLFTVPGETSSQRLLFDLLDILLTAGLLAGGSNGIAVIMETIRGTAPKPGADPNVQLIAPQLRSYIRHPPSMGVTTPAVTVNQMQPETKQPD
jgi:hypothetical protein